MMETNTTNISLLAELKPGTRFLTWRVCGLPALFLSAYLKTIDIDHRLSKFLRSFLRQIVSDSARDQTMGVLA